MLRPMRALLVLTAMAGVAGLATLLADAAAPAFVSLGPGSVGIEPWANGFVQQPAEPGCGTGPEERMCVRQLGFRPDGTVVVWFSVRNDGPVAVTFLGPSAAWFAEYAAVPPSGRGPDVVPLGRPIGALDAGGTEHGVPELQPVPFGPVTLDPNEERIVGVEFVTTTLADACANWAGGGGVAWPSITVGWRWLLAEHDQELPFAEPIEFMAPSEDECA